MKPFKSIKWRLQIWYGLILVLVLAGFGVTAYELERGRQMGRIDDELRRRFSILAGALRPLHPLEQGLPPLGRARGQGPGVARRRPDFPPPKFELPPWASGLFGTNQPEGFYFVINSRNNGEIARGGDVPSHVGPNPFSLSKVNRAPSSIGAPPPTWTENGFREIFDLTPSGETIIVGCSIEPELHELNISALELACVGGVILFVGLAGGWKIVNRAIQPIESISATAAKITAGDLSQRINIAETESELGQLAAVLNSTFARLDAAFTQQKQFASDAAHELRTPVSVILTQTQTALNRERAAAEYRETIEACQRAAQRMRKLIGALLELARLDAGQEPMKRLKFDLAQIARECAELLRPLAEAREVKISTELASLEITGDAERLAQVVTNLLTNAIQHNRPGGEARMKLEREAGMAVLAVSDTGAGISKEDLPHVFKRFYRGDKSRTGANAGLGLAISKAIVEAHGGAIEVSGEEDVGTIFTVRLPI